MTKTSTVAALAAALTLGATPALAADAPRGKAPERASGQAKRPADRPASQVPERAPERAAERPRGAGDTAGARRPANSPDAMYTLPEKPAPKGKAHGVRCKAFSKKRVRGQKGTPFSRCVKALAQLEKGGRRSARAVCAPLAKRKRPGQRKSDFAKCVVAGKELLRAKPRARKS